MRLASRPIMHEAPTGAKFAVEESTVWFAVPCQISHLSVKFRKYSRTAVDYLLRDFSCPYQFGNF